MIITTTRPAGCDLLHHPHGLGDAGPALGLGLGAVDADPDSVTFVTISRTTLTSHLILKLSSTKKDDDSKSFLLMNSRNPQLFSVLEKVVKVLALLCDGSGSPTLWCKLNVKQAFTTPPIAGVIWSR